MTSETTPRRPTLADLQRAQLHALRKGDRRRAAAFQMLVWQRIERLQQESRRHREARETPPPHLPDISQHAHSSHRDSGRSIGALHG